RQRLPAEKQRRDDRLADEAAQGLDLVLDHGGHFRRLYAAEMRQRKAQDPVEEREAKPPQHAFAHPALHGVDLELEQPADDDQREESERQDDQVGRALEGHALEQDRLAAEEFRQDRRNAQERDGRVGIGEALALDRLVDDG